MLCCDWTLVKHFHDHVIAEPLKCRCWTCDYCQPFRAAELKRQALAGKPNTFLTLTVNPMVGKDPDHRARSLVRAWRLIRLRAIRKYKYQSIPFIAVFEVTKRGEPHLHILCRVAWIDQRWLSRQMAGLMSAPIVDIRRIKHLGQLANYVAKYVGKDPHSFKRCKRYWASHDYAPSDHEYQAPDPGPSPTFTVERLSLEEYSHQIQQIDYVFIRETRRGRIFQYGPYHRKGAPLSEP